MERDVHLCSGGSVADGAGTVHDDRDLVVVAVKDGEGAEMQAADVGHDSGETRRDALLRDFAGWSEDNFRVADKPGIHPVGRITNASRTPNLAAAFWKSAGDSGGVACQ
jgi:hypothetical protein